MSYGELRPPIHCTTEQFWEAMRCPAFVRTGRLTGQIGLGQFLCVGLPPEEVDGFLARKGREALVAIRTPRYELACYDAAVAGLPKPPKPLLHQLRDVWSRVWNR